MEVLSNIFKITLITTAILMLLVIVYSIIAGFIQTIKANKIKKHFNKILPEILEETLKELAEETKEEMKSNSNPKKKSTKKSTSKKENK